MVVLGSRADDGGCSGQTYTHKVGSTSKELKHRVIIKYFSLLGKFYYIILCNDDILICLKMPSFIPSWENEICSDGRSYKIANGQAKWTKCKERLWFRYQININHSSLHVMHFYITEIGSWYIEGDQFDVSFIKRYIFNFLAIQVYQSYFSAM